MCGRWDDWFPILAFPVSELYIHALSHVTLKFCPFLSNAFDVKLRHETFFGQWNMEVVTVCQFKAKIIKSIKYSHFSCPAPVFHQEEIMRDGIQRGREMWSGPESKLQPKAELPSA